MTDKITPTGRLRRCATCEEWLPIDAFHKCGKDANGEQMWRGTCKYCRPSWREDAEASDKTPCANCDDLELCREIIAIGDPDELLPCFEDGYKKRGSKRWFIDIGVVNERWRRETYKAA